MTPRYTLRDLPLAAKLVASIFLLAVGLGYFSALVQLHLQHSTRNGEALPSDTDVVAIFAGKKKFDPAAPVTVSKLEKLVMGPRDAFNGSISMSAAFFDRDSDNGLDGARYKSLIKENPKEAVDASREGEQLAVKYWINLPEAERKAAYESDKLTNHNIKTITKEYLAGETIKVKSILEHRCARCHGKDGEQAGFPLETYENISKYLDAPRGDVPDARGWVASDRFVSIEKLTQSTHAHLLSFAMLFGLTGFLFAFTNLPAIVRFLVAPSVLLAQVCDVSCWWLARIPDVGVFFAYAILVTGSLVGLGLITQILGCLFDMYRWKGRVVLLVLFALAAAGFSVLYTKAIEPALAAQKK